MSITTESLDVFINIRPSKIAFFIPEEIEAFLNVIDVCEEIWGGIFSLIIPVKTNYFIQTPFFQLLEIVDPDFLVLYRSLEKDKILQIKEIKSLSFFDVIHFDLLKRSKLWSSPIPEIKERDPKPFSKWYKMMDALQNIFLEDDLEGNFGKIKKMWSSDLNSADRGLMARVKKKTDWFPHFLLILTDSFNVNDLCLFWNTRGLYYHIRDPEFLLIPKTFFKDQSAREIFSDYLLSELNNSGTVFYPQIAILSLSLDESNIDDLLINSDDDLFVKSDRKTYDIFGGCVFPLEYRNILSNLDEHFNSFELTNLHSEHSILKLVNNSLRFSHSLPKEIPFSLQHVVFELSVDRLFDLPNSFKFEDLFSSSSKESKVLLKGGSLCYLISTAKKNFIFDIVLPGLNQVFQQFFGQFNLKFDKTSRTDPIIQIIAFLDGYDEDFQDDFLSEEVYGLFKQLSPISRRKMEKFIKEQGESLDEEVKKYLSEASYVSTNRFKLYNELCGILGSKSHLLEELIRKKILIRGYNIKCNYCNIDSWFPFGQLKESFTCIGCGKANSTPILQGNSDLRIRYILNTLQQQAVDQDYFPEIKALLELRKSIYSNFFWFPSCKLIKGNSEIELDGLILNSEYLTLIEAKLTGEINDEQINHLKTFSEIFEEKIPVKVILFSMTGWQDNIREKYSSLSRFEFKDLSYE